MIPVSLHTENGVAVIIYTVLVQMFMLSLSPNQTNTHRGDCVSMCNLS